MPKISELSNPGSGHSVTGGELIVVTTQGLSSISLSANDLVNRALDVIDTGTGANLKSTYTSFNANSAEYESAYSTLKSNSAEYESAYSTLKSNSGSYTYVASNSATLQADTTVAGSLSTNDTLIIGGRGTFGSDHIVTDNILTVFGNISAQGTIYASGSALGEVNPVNPGGSNRTIQYNDSNAFGGAVQFAYDETNHNVGIGTQAIAITDNIHEKLTVSGNISATGKIYNEDGEIIGADLTEVVAGSASWDSTYSDVKANSASWNSAATNAYAVSADIAEIAAVSANWNSTYNQVQDASTDLNIDTKTFYVDKSADKVGIGVDNPGEKLSVLGSISASSTLKATTVEATTVKATTLGLASVAVATLSAGDATTIGALGIGVTNPAYKLHVAAPNTSTIAISAFGEIHAGGDIQSSSSSDKRQKKNIKNLENALDKVATLDGVEYDWNELASAHRIGKHDVGVIAQQVEEVLPDAIERRENGMMAVRYERLIPLLIESIKELKSEIDELKSK